jgi:hypothetical protein
VRRLTASEQRFLQGYFGEALDLDPIRLGTSLGRRSWSPYGARISLVWSLYVAGDPDAQIELENPQTAAVFAHEAVHVWQRQRGRAVTRQGAVLQTLYTLGWFDPYAYRHQLLDARCLLSEFVLGNIEQQGRIFQDYVLADRLGRATGRFAKVATWVRLSVGK